MNVQIVLSTRLPNQVTLDREVYKLLRKYSGKAFDQKKQVGNEINQYIYQTDERNKQLRVTLQEGMSANVFSGVKVKQTSFSNLLPKQSA